MIEEGGFGPIIQMDVSRSVVENMRLRCDSFVSNGSMKVVLDDATELSAFRDGMIDACIDKGLLDAIFCASNADDDFDQLHQIITSVSRVLRPNGSFLFFSLSRPEFLLPALLGTASSKWRNIQVQQLPKIILYIIQKTDDSVFHIKRNSGKRKIRRR